MTAQEGGEIRGLGGGLTAEEESGSGFDCSGRAGGVGGGEGLGTEEESG